MSKDSDSRNEYSLHIITWPFKLLYKFAMVIVISWVLTICIGLFFHYEVFGEAKAGADFKEIYYSMIQDQYESSFSAKRINFISMAGDASYRLAFEITGFDQMIVQFTSGKKPDGLDGVAYEFVRSNSTMFESLIWIIRIWGAKFALMISAIPLYLFAYFIALVDGLVLRYIRREGGGRESAFIHHQSKYVIYMLGGLFLFLMISIPFIFRPFILPLSAIAVGLLARFQWQYYKKYM